MAKSSVAMRGFLRGQIVDSKTGKIEADTGWIKNSATQTGLTNLALLIAGTTTNCPAVSGQLGTSFNSASTVLGGSGNALAALTPSTSGTCTATFTCSFAGTNGSLNVGAAGLVAANSALIAGQTFASSAMATNQNFNLNDIGSFIGNDEKQTIEIAGNTLELQLLIAEAELIANSENVEDWSISREAEKSEPSETIMVAPVFNGMKI